MARPPPDISQSSAPSKYQALFDRMDQGLCILQVIFDADDRPIDYRFLEVNRVFEQQLGMAGALGKTIREIAPDIEPFWVDLYGRVALNGESALLENYSKPFDRWFGVNAFRIGDPDDRQVAVIFRDITERKRRENHHAFLADITEDFTRLPTLQDVMQVVGAKLGTYLDVSCCLFCEVDETGNSIATSYGWHRDGEPSLLRTYRMRECLGPQFTDDNRANRPVLVSDTRVDPRTHAPSYAALDIRSFLTVPHHQDGEWKYCIGVTDPLPRQWRPDEVQLFQELGSRIFSRLDRANADSALRASEARFRLMADAVPNIIWIADAEGRAEFFNRQWEEYTGLANAPAEPGESVAAVVHPDDIDRVIQRFEAARSTGSTYQAEHRIRSASGGYRWFLARAEPHRDELTGRVIRWFGASVDIHDRKLAEEALEGADRRKDVFLATLAHELRNPLAPIRTGLTVLEMAPSADVATRTRAVMARQLEHMVRLIDDLLDISRININKIELDRQRLDLRHILDTAIEGCRPAIDAGEHQLTVSYPATPIRLEADATRLAQIIGNLLGNAARYTPTGGRIEVSVQMEGPVVAISVRDNGEGIAPESMPVLFELFSQVGKPPESSPGGLGIGLALVKRLVEMHGGTVTAQSPGLSRGSTFTVRLPAFLDAGLLCDETSDGVPEHGLSLRILVVDDNIDAADTLGDLLSLTGHQVGTVHLGLQAVEAARSFKPDAIFLDIGLPDIDGYQVAQQLRAEADTRDVTLIALTGWGADHDVERAMASGFDHHLTKPAGADEIAALLTSLAPAQPSVPGTATAA